jgi:hypothetical protein
VQIHLVQRLDDTAAHREVTADVVEVDAGAFRAAARVHGRAGLQRRAHTFLLATRTPR